MIHYKSIDQSQFAEGTDIKEQERVFDDFLQDTLLEIQGSHINKTNRIPHNVHISNQPDEEVPYIFLRTCNRSEIYYGEGEVPDEVARHLFRVVSGLESAIVGERAVQGQVKEAYYTAKAQRPLTAELHRLFQSALQVGKRVRNETEISHGAVSHSLAALEIIESLGNVDVRNARITIIGVNKLTSDILKFLQNKGARMVFLANRSQIKAHYLADPLGIKVYTLDEKQEFPGTNGYPHQCHLSASSHHPQGRHPRAEAVARHRPRLPSRHRFPTQRTPQRPALQHQRRGEEGA